MLPLAGTKKKVQNGGGNLEIQIKADSILFCRTLVFNLENFILNQTWLTFGNERIFLRTFFSKYIVMSFSFCA